VSKIKRIRIPISPTSSNIAVDWAAQLATLQRFIPTGNWTYLHYSDTSPFGHWGYWAEGMLLESSGDLIIATIECRGVAHPASGTNHPAVPDPGLPGSWTAIGAPFTIMADEPASEKDGGNGGQQVVLFTVPGNSLSASTDLAALAGLNTENYDEVFSKFKWAAGGYWAYYLVSMANGAPEAYPPQPVVIMAHGCTNPPLGSAHPAVADPMLTGYTTLGAPFDIAYLPSLKKKAA